MGEGLMTAIYRIATFHKDFRGRDVMEIYLDSPRSKRPFFTALVGKEAVVKFLGFLNISYEDKGDYLLFEDREDEVLRKLVIFAGVRQTFRAIREYQERMLMSFIRNLTVVEDLFWFSRFMLYDYVVQPSVTVRRVARAFRVLYGF
jgi:hypothetical protein